MLRLFYSIVIGLCLAVTSALVAWNDGFDKGYICGAVDVTIGGVQLEKLCDRHGNCTLPEQYSK